MVIDDIDDLIADGVDGLQADTKVGAAVDGLEVDTAVGAAVDGLEVGTTVGAAVEAVVGLMKELLIDVLMVIELEW